MITGVSLLVALVLIVCTGLAIDTPEAARPVFPPIAHSCVPPAPTAPLDGYAAPAWTIGRAGLVGPSAWLTAPRETDSFAARRAAIHAAYQAADMPVAAVLAAAGWPIGG